MEVKTWKVRDVLREMGDDANKEVVTNLLAEYERTQRDLKILQRLILALKVDDYPAY